MSAIDQLTTMLANKSKLRRKDRGGDGDDKPDPYQVVHEHLQRTLHAHPKLDRAAYARFLTHQLDGKCAPGREDHFLKTGSCLKLDELERVARTVGVKPPAKATYRSLIPALRAKLQASCGAGGNESCWVEKNPELYRDLGRNYRPRMPKTWKRNRREWLTTVDILNVMQQYEKAHAHFKFLGVFPIDFASKDASSGSCISQVMCSLDTQELQRQGKTTLGMVFNLDRHDQSGSHWVSCFCDLRPSSPKFGACFYDSAGARAPPEVKRFMEDKLRPRLNQKHKEFQLKWNNTQHQFKNTECGVFSMVFLIMCLRHPDETYRATRARIPTDKSDDAMNRQRDVLFRA